jgi:hypothetical protein
MDGREDNAKSHFLLEKAPKLSPGLVLLAKVCPRLFHYSKFRPTVECQTLVMHLAHLLISKYSKFKFGKLTKSFILHFLTLHTPTQNNKVCVHLDTYISISQSTTLQFVNSGRAFWHKSLFSDKLWLHKCWKNSIRQIHQLDISTTTTRNLPI